jgi:2-dehydropantoate 2-reductase
MRIGVFGAGSIGCYTGGLLASTGVDIVFVGRERVKTEVDQHGLTLRDLDGGARAVPPINVSFAMDPAALIGCDLILVAVKSAQTGASAQTLATLLDRPTTVISLQNGLRNATTLRTHLPKHRVLAGIVGFNVVSKGDGQFLRATSGDLIIEAGTDSRVADIAQRWRATGLVVQQRADIRALQWSKLVMNLNNAVSALSNVPITRMLFEPAYRRIVRAIIAEAVSVLARSRVATARFGKLPVRFFPPLLALPTPLVRILLSAQLRVDPEARSSMWDDLMRGRKTEVDELNGEIVQLARSIGGDAPINSRVCEVIHEAEARGPGSPSMSAEALATALGI